MNKVFVGTAIGVLLLAGGLVAGCTQNSAPTHQPSPAHQPPKTSGGEPHAVTENKGYDIESLTPVQIDDLLQGRGANLALAAECNDAPGPLHVVELADRMQLTPDQREIAQKLTDRMRGEARVLGQRIVNVEQTLDDGFKSGTMNAERLAAMTASSASLNGELRNVHLRTHLEMRGALTEQQIDIYYESRQNNGKCTP